MKAQILSLLLIIVLVFGTVFYSKQDPAGAENIVGAWYNSNIHVLLVFFPDGTYLSTYLINPPTYWLDVPDWHVKGHWKLLGNHKFELRFPFRMKESDNFMERREEIQIIEPGELMGEEARIYEKVELIDPRTRL